MKHMERDFCSDAWVMPKGLGLGGAGGAQGGGGQKRFEYGHVVYQIEGDDD